jgi:hypothetical protein
MKQNLSVPASIITLCLFLTEFLAPASMSAEPAKGIDAPNRARSRVARLGDQVRVQAAGRGNPFINLADGRELLTSYVGTERQVSALMRRQTRGLSIASDDFD